MGFWGSFEFIHIAHKLDSYYPGLALIWYNAGALFGIFLAAFWRRPVLAALSPLLGGLLVSSGIGVLMGRLLALAETKMSPVPPWLTQVKGFFPSEASTWLMSFTSLLGRKPSMTIALQCGCSFLGLVLYRLTKRKHWPMVLFVVVGVVASLVLGAFNMGCQLTKMSCPNNQWKWLVTGGFVWFSTAICSVKGHLSLLEKEGGIQFDWRLGGYRKVAASSTNATWTKLWEDLTNDEKASAMTLGWDRQMWDDGSIPPSESKKWKNLKYFEQEAAEKMGWTQDTWDTKAEDGSLELLLNNSR
jgi:hypothetical protein